MSNSSKNIKCHCCSGVSFARCCEPLLSGTSNAKSPLELMRSRYSAFVTKNHDYILKTMAKKAAHQHNKNTDLENNSLTWTHLEILHAPPPSDKFGEVEFIAHYQTEGITSQMHEHSLFEKINNTWFYVDSKNTIPEERKPKRNEPCPCGSNLKYKKCCIGKY